VTPNIKTVQL